MKIIIFAQTHAGNLPVYSIFTFQIFNWYYIFEIQRSRRSYLQMDDKLRGLWLVQ